MKKNILISILIALINCFGATAAIIYEGMLGDNISWTFSDKYVLTFSGAGKLTSGCRYAVHASEIIIKDGITSIDEGAFMDCPNFKSITIPKSVTSIGGGAFYGCNQLTAITISANVKNIGEAAFGECFGLKTIRVEAGNKYYDSRNNCNAIIETASNKLIVGTSDTHIPEGVTIIGTCAFMRCGFSTIKIPNSVTSIGELAFQYCENLSSIIIPEGVTSIDKYAFSRCRSLKSVTIPNSVTTIGMMAFEGCGELTSIEIPNSVTSIESNAFQSCYNLSITLPERFKGKVDVSDCKNVTYY